MNLRFKILAGALPAAAGAALLLLSFLFFRHRRRQLRQPLATPPKSKTLQNKFHLSYKSNNSLRFHHLHHHSPAISPPSQKNSPATTSPELLQTVRLRRSSGEQNFEQNLFFFRANFALPGPVSGGGAFSQEAYFEISLLCLRPWKNVKESDGISSADPIMFSSGLSTEKRRFEDVVVVSVGLIGREDMSNQNMPGTFSGSIGFHSDGSIYLDGKKLVFESEKAEWGDVNRVIGCGFAPKKKKVFFTVDSQLVFVIRCSSEVYSSPLFPVLAANSDAMILVNLGQTPFKYAPANATRTKNPSFVRISSASAIDGFSVNRMEAEWCEYGRKSRNQNKYYSSSSKKSNGFLDEGLEAESDLFEISLQR